MAEKIRYASRATVMSKALQVMEDGVIPKQSIAKDRKELLEAYQYIANLKNMSHCVYCNTYKDKDKDFYFSTDPMNKSQSTPCCRECAKAVALRKDKNGEYHDPTPESVIDALYLLNKPWHQSVWDSSVREASNLITGKTKNNAWSSYIKNISMVNYVSESWRDSDFFKNTGNGEPTFYEDEVEKRDAYQLSKMDEEDIDEFEKNKADVKRLLGYLPYESESAEDQVQLYGQLIGLIDAGGDENDDMIRNQSCISICRNFLQVSKIDASIATLMSDVKNIEVNSASIKSLQASKKDIMAQITSLAAESCISLKNSRNKSRGDNTWSGKIKRIQEMNLLETNGFDIKTCKGMQQVREISDASIMKQLALDDSEWSDMVAEMRTTVRKLYDERDAYKEINRILLKENLDLRDTLIENHLSKETDFIELGNLYSSFRDQDKNEDENEADGESINESEDSKDV